MKTQSHTATHAETTDQLLARLATVITTELRTAMNGMVADGVPPAAIAHCMLQLAATIIRDTEGPNQLRQSFADTLNDLIRPRD